MAPLDVPALSRSRRRAARGPAREAALLRALRSGPIPVWLPLMLGFLAAVGPISTDIYLPAFPRLEASLHAPSGSAQLTLATWFAGLSIGQLVQGPLSDRVGRRVPLLLGTIVFTLASAGCALAWSIDSLSVFRFLAALGASASMVVPRAIVRDLRDGQDARRLMARLLLVMGAVPIAAPSLGGLLLVVASWRVIFWIAAIYGIVVLVLVWRALPDTLPRDRRLRVPLAGQLSRYLIIIREHGFVTNASLGGMALFGLFAYLGGSPIAYVREYGLTPPQYALAFSANAAVFIGMSQVSVSLTARLGPDRALTLASNAFVVAALIMLAVALTGAGGLAGLLVAIGLNLACIGLMGPVAPIAALARHAAHAGSASAMLGTLQYFLAAVATFLVGLLDDGTARPMALLMLLAAACVKLRPRLPTAP